MIQAENKTWTRSEWSFAMAGSGLFEVAKLCQVHPHEVPGKIQQRFISSHLSYTGIKFRRLSKKSFGKFVYPFNHPILIAELLDKTNVAIALPEATELKGIGSSNEVARRDLKLRFHLTYQKLSSAIPSELSASETAQWNSIHSIVNTELMRELTPANRRKIGIVTCRYPFRITWWGDEDELEIDLSTSPCQLAAFDVGDWFDASVEFDRKHRQVLRILTVQRLPPRAEKPYDDNKLAREMMELKKISPDDI